MKFLAGIAMGMRREAAQGIARHRLRRGLALTLRRDNGDWVLSLSRQDVPPSEKEEEVCRRAFKVNGEADRHMAEIDNWYIVRLRWKDEPAQLFVVEIAPASVYYQEGL